MGLDKIGSIGSYGSGDRGYGMPSVAKARRSAQVPDAIVGPPTVRGALDKDIIRRVVRRNLNQVRFCYEQEMTHTPGLHGRLSVQFTIAGTGKVTTASVAESTTGSAGVDACVSEAVRRWEFPQPQGGGIVIVSYPFVFQLAGQN